MRVIGFTLLLVLQFINICAQQIVDPCFLSIKELGFFYGSNDIQNVCKCLERNLAADMMEWDPSSNTWKGELKFNNLQLVPPAGCNVRAFWLGNSSVTFGGEAVALRLDSALVPGKKYTYAFTYGSDGFQNFHNFSPIILTDSDPPTLDNNPYQVGRLTPTDGWRTDSITFTATENQKDHNWLIIHAVESSGTVLSNCVLKNPIQKDLLFEKDSVFCDGDQVEIDAPIDKYYKYAWSTGDTTSSIKVTQPGNYSVDVQYYKCSNKDSVNLRFIDCEVRIDMPNVFTPGNDNLNEIFKPISYNYIESGKMHIYNRWEQKIYDGPLFEGWNGHVRGDEAPAGVYFYELNFTDFKGKYYSRKGIVTLVR